MAPVDQDRFLYHVRRALGHDAGISRQWSVFVQPPDSDRLQVLVRRVTKRSHSERLGLLDTLVNRCRQSDIGIHIADQPQEAVRLIAGLAQSRCSESEEARDVILWRHPLLEKLNLIKRLPQAGVTTIIHAGYPDRSVQDAAAEDRQRAEYRRQLVCAGIGITSADFCLADSATLVMKTHPGRPRAVSLVPPVHVAVITLAEILFDLQELYAMLGDPASSEGQGITNCMTFISGPSTTRDIEAIPVAGAQGPRELHIVVISGVDI